MLKRAFSLVELSIVLVILGLLTGGILAGQSLIRAAATRSVVVDMQKFATAGMSFRDKYFALPGDMANAESFWTKAGGATPAACMAIDSGGVPTCNGNGDGNIAAAYIANDETTRAWQHLANAGLIEGRYSGVFGSGPVPGTNFPSTKLGGSNYWYLGSTNPALPSSTTAFARPAGVTLYNTGTTALSLNGPESWNIDTKMDDGLPGTGKIIAYKGTASFPCTSAVGLTAPADAGATYTLTSDAMNCYLFFVQPF